MTPDDPRDYYEPPKAQPLEHWDEIARPMAGHPGVWPWYVTYCVFMALVYLLVGVAVVAAATIGPTGPDVDEADRVVFPIVAAVMGLLFLGFGVAFAAAPFLPKRPCAWVYGIVLICLGLTSCCTLPACIPLLIHWLKPETKWYFGRT